MNRASLVLAMVVLVSGCASPVAPASPSTAAEAGWQRLDLPNGGGANLLSIAATAHDVVIVGNRGMTPAAWASRDGGPWAFEQLGPENAFPETAMAFGDRVLAVGSTQTNRCAHPSSTVFWVRAADGRWTAAPFDKLFCAGSESVPAVAHTDDRLATVGIGTADIAFAWSSDDGLTWVDRPIRPDVYPNFVTPVAGGFAAIGIFGAGGWWVGRSDGRKAWTIAPLPNTPADAFPMGLADRGAGLIAWFMTGGREIGALTTETGEVWRSTGLQGMTGAAPGRVIRTAAGYVALAEMPDARPGMFVSRDGVRWRVVAGPIDDRPGNYVRLAISDERAVLLGDVRVGDEGIPTAWSAPASLFEP